MVITGKLLSVHHSNKYSLFTVPASALILFSPTVAPASPWRVPREVKEFMAAPAVEFAVDAATKVGQSRKCKITFAVIPSHRLPSVCVSLDYKSHNSCCQYKEGENLWNLAGGLFKSALFKSLKIKQKPRIKTCSFFRNN